MHNLWRWFTALKPAHKLVVIILTPVLLCCCAGLVVGMVDSSARQVGLLPTYTPTLTLTPAATKTPLPTQTPIPTPAPTSTPAATLTLMPLRRTAPN